MKFDFDFPAFRQNTSRLYRKIFGEVLKKYGLTKMEVDLVLFLACMPKYDTAAQIVKMRGLTKSQVSVAVNHLVEEGYLVRNKECENQKQVHLKLLAKAEPLVKDGKCAHKEFMHILLKDFTTEEVDLLKGILLRIQQNAKES